MRLYTFDVTGASPFDGEITIVNKDMRGARKLAEAKILEYNGSTFNSKIRLTGEERSEPFFIPMVVHFVSGES